MQGLRKKGAANNDRLWLQLKCGQSRHRDSGIEGTDPLDKEGTYDLDEESTDDMNKKGTDDSD